jgi:hypothetical protein
LLWLPGTKQEACSRAKYEKSAVLKDGLRKREFVDVIVMQKIKNKRMQERSEDV